ncbi:hypothetical protein [Idiomarina abyssalis]|uniref:hypothetical protein n=1 Tax=Idiomarina abyssalis TaxID=86102 RepID=UPI003A8DB1E3
MSEKNESPSPWTPAKIVGSLILALGGAASLIVIVTAIQDPLTKLTKLESDFQSHINTINPQLTKVLDFEPELISARHQINTLQNDLKKAQATLAGIESKLNEVDKQSSTNSNKIDFLRSLTSNLSEERRSKISNLTREQKVALAEAVIEAVQSDTSFTSMSYPLLLPANVGISEDEFRELTDEAKSMQSECNSIEDITKVECQL